MSVEQLYDMSILSCFLTECFNNDTSGKKKKACFLQWFDLSQTCCQKKKKKKEAGKCYTYKSRDVENEVNGLWPSKRKITHTYTSGNFCQ